MALAVLRFFVVKIFISRHESFVEISEFCVGCLQVPDFLGQLLDDLIALDILSVLTNELLYFFAVFATLILLFEKALLHLLELLFVHPLHTDLELLHFCVSALNISGLSLLVLPKNVTHFFVFFFLNLLCSFVELILHLLSFFLQGAL